MEKLNSKIRTVWIIKHLLLVFVITFAIIVLPFQSSLFALGFLAVFSGIAVVYNIKRYDLWNFEIKKDNVYIERGVIVKIRTMMPFVRIQHVDTRRGILDRIFGLSRVVIFTAGSRGADVVIPGLKPDRAEEIQEHLRDVAIDSEDKFGDAV